MGTMTQTLTSTPKTAITNPKPMRVCFSFAAYAKNLIDQLKTCNIPIQEGLSDAEFAQIESSLGFLFPPDLRSLLREGLPVGPGFPNWRSASHQQLEILTNLPVLGICKEVSTTNLWFNSWGSKPSNPTEAINLARRFLKKAPVLVPIYRHFYIPSSSPNLAGNPVFYVNGSDVKLSSFDLTIFFQEIELWPNSLKVLTRNTPAWAATSARRVDYWSEMAERARGFTRGWWSGKLGACLEEVYWRLKDGGWKEEEIREMMMMTDSRDKVREKRDEITRPVARNKEEGVGWHVRALSLRMLHGGWKREEVIYSLGCNYFDGENDVVIEDELSLKIQRGGQ